MNIVAGRRSFKHKAKKTFYNKEVQATKTTWFGTAEKKYDDKKMTGIKIRRRFFSVRMGDLPPPFFPLLVAAANNFKNITCLRTPDYL